MIGRKLAWAVLGVLSLGIAGTTPVALRRDEPAPAPPAPKLPPLQTPDEAIKAALADLTASVSPANWCYTRYIWVQDDDMRSKRTNSLAMAYLNRGPSPQRPYIVPSGYFSRIDLRQYFPDGKDLEEGLKFWEELSFDPAFALLITKDSVASDIRLKQALHRTVTRRVAVPGPITKRTIIVDHAGGEYVYPDDSGRRHANLPAGRYECELEFRGQPTYRDVAEDMELILGRDVDVLRLNALHIDDKSFVRLQELTHSLAPVVENRYFKSRALTTIKDRGVWKEVFGGLYYEFRGVRKSNDAAATDLDLFFETLGIGHKGERAEALFDRLRSDQRVAIFRSLVTGKPREVDSFHTPADKEGGSWGAITGDVRDSSIDIGDNPVANLLKPRREAREAIFPTATSFPIFALFNGEGALQNEVPPDIAVDSTIPAPHTRRLQPAIGCLRCHGTDGSDGWKPLVNDVKRLLDGRGLDSFGDLSAGFGAFDFNTVDRQAGLFAGDFSKNLRRARDDLAEATLKATGPWEGGTEDQSDAAKLAAKRLADEYAEFNYDSIDAHKALQELGLRVPPFKSLEVFRQLVPPDLRQQGLIREDPRIAALRQGLSINRADWALSFAYAAERAQQSLKKGVKLP